MFSRLVLARDKREALLRLADRLSLDLGYEAEPGPREEPGRESRRRTRALDSEDEHLVSRLRGALAALAAEVGSEAVMEYPSKAVATALDCAELVMRGELLQGNGAQIPSLLPSFVFLVTLPVSGQDGALELARQTKPIVDREVGA
jgi:hypothetical protein